MGAKLFKSALLYLGENIDKPFIDILNQLERIDILTVDEWFEIRDLRKEIAHNYEANESEIIGSLNTIIAASQELRSILNHTETLIGKH